MKPHFSLILGTAILAACSNPQKPSDEVLLSKVAPTPPGAEKVRHTALLLGRLVVDNGCVRLNAGQRTTVLWDDEVELDQTGPVAMLRDTSSGKTYRIADQVRLGGGERPSEYVSRDYPEVARRCDEPYASGYFASDVSAP